MPKGLPPVSSAIVGVVTQVYFCVETAGKHPLMLADQILGDADIVEAKAGKLGQENSRSSHRAGRG